MIYILINYITNNNKRTMLIYNIECTVVYKSLYCILLHSKNYYI